MFPRKIILYFAFLEHLFNNSSRKFISIHKMFIIWNITWSKIINLSQGKSCCQFPGKSRSGFRKTKYQSKSTPRSLRGYNHILPVKLGKLFYFCLSILCNNSDRIYKKKHVSKPYSHHGLYAARKKRKFQFHLYLFILLYFYLIYIWNLIFISFIINLLSYIAQISNLIYFITQCIN